MDLQLLLSSHLTHMDLHPVVLMGHLQKILMDHHLKIHMDHLRKILMVHHLKIRMDHLQKILMVHHLKIRMDHLQKIHMVHRLVVHMARHLKNHMDHLQVDHMDHLQKIRTDHLQKIHMDPLQKIHMDPLQKIHMGHLQKIRMGHLQKIRMDLHLVVRMDLHPVVLMGRLQKIRMDLHQVDHMDHLQVDLMDLLLNLHTTHLQKNHTDHHQVDHTGRLQLDRMDHLPKVLMDLNQVDLMDHHQVDHMDPLQKIHTDHHQVDHMDRLQKIRTDLHQVDHMDHLQVNLMDLLLNLHTTLLLKNHMDHLQVDHTDLLQVDHTDHLPKVHMDLSQVDLMDHHQVDHMDPLQKILMAHLKNHMVYHHLDHLVHRRNLMGYHQLDHLGHPRSLMAHLLSLHIILHHQVNHMVSPSKDTYGIPSLGFIDNSLQIQYASPSASSYNGLPPEGTFGTPLAICCGTPPPDLVSQKPADSQYGLTYGQASGRQIPGPNLQPKSPVKNRAPVPPGLVESTQYNSFQGEPYIPPPVSEVSATGNDAYAAPSSSTGYSSSNSNPGIEHSPIVSQDQQQYTIPVTQDTPNNGLYNQGLSTSYALPAPESYQHITQTVSVNNANQEPNSYVQPNQLLLSNVDNYGTPQQAFDLNQQIEENKNNPQQRDTENNSQQSGNNNYQQQPDGVDVNDIVKSLGLEGSSVVGSKSVDINGIQEYPVQGSNGNYMLQIQPGQGGGENVAHDQVLSNGLLQDILSAIENQQKSDNSYDNQPQGSEVRQITTAAVNTSTEWPENSANKKQEMALFYSTRDGKGQSTQGTETLPNEINHLSVNEVSNGNFVSYKSPKVNYVYSESSPQAVSQAYSQQSTPKTDESSTDSLSSTGK
ncbi:unnamed protein product [Aphis gossypii]|uniref:Uncharacterized protein n=1 Tax=Aphis gossypii TaxID=80765 RepID=A0A9P0J0Y2_APHGO|nr:unnamed protein product [Aphis gossypii]